MRRSVISAVGFAITDADVDERHRRHGGAGEMFDGPAEHGVFDGREIAVQDRADERANHRTLTAGKFGGSVVETGRSRVERVDPCGAAGM